MRTPQPHRFIARTEWAGGQELSRARLIVAIDPGTVGAVVLVERDPSGPLDGGGQLVAWGQWKDGNAAKVIDRVGQDWRRIVPRSRDYPPPVVLVEEPFFARSGAASIVQGWDAGWVATAAAVQVGALDIVRVAAEVWQSEILGRPTGEDKRASRKAAAVARLPIEMARSATNRPAREALADAFGLACWGLLL